MIVNRKSRMKRPVVNPTGDSKCPLRQVKQVIFGILDPDEILRMSVTPESIQQSQLYDMEGNPVVSGLLDPRQGVVDKNSKCKTCLGLMGDCPGHFGHIELAEPVFHSIFLPKIIKILRCVCYFCNQLLIPLTNLRLLSILKQSTIDDRRRFTLVYQLCKGKSVCYSDVPAVSGEIESTKTLNRVCGRRQPKYKQQGLEIIMEWERLDIENHERKQLFYPKLVRNMFAKISNETCRILGMNPRFSRPEWMVATLFVVPPISIRPTAITFSGAKNQDDLTYKLADIVNANEELKAAKAAGATQRTVEELLSLLQYHIATLVDNEIPGVPRSVHKSSGKLIKGIKARLKGKEGRLRGNLMGKRVDFSARTVISPDPRLRIDQVGVPYLIAQNLTVPETVTPYNLKRMEELIKKGPKLYPGAKLVCKPNGDRIDLRYCHPSKVRLQPGFQVERDLIDGDVVVFNRQPTLHKMSMMAHYVKVLPHSTLRLNLSCTTPYNADFDGDEMNVHVPQSLDVMTEVASLQLTTKQIITPQSNRPVMGIVQDALTGAQKMTRRDVFLDKGMLMNLMMHVTTWNGLIPRPAIMKPVQLWTGKQLFSLIIPGKLSLIRNHSSHSDEEERGSFPWISCGDTKVLVSQGELLSGILCRKTLGASPGSLLHVSSMELGHHTTGIFYGDIQNVVNAWLSTSGHSIGIQDVLLDSKTESKVVSIIDQAKVQVEKIAAESKMEIKNYGAHAYDDNGDTKGEERYINSLLNDAVCKAGRYVQESLNDKNNLKVMVTAGAKGSLINIAQITACVGQLNIEGQRIQRNEQGRTLPHFSLNSNSPECQGFVASSFFKGISPPEYFFQSMAGREGLIDTAVKTAETGYIQRRLMKAMESIMVQYDGTVRNGLGHVIQFCYGEDGLAGEKVEFQKMPTIMLPDQQFRALYKFDLQTLQKSRLEQIFTKSVVSVIISRRLEIQQILNDEWKHLEDDRAFLRKLFKEQSDTVVLPCNMKRIIRNTCIVFRLKKNSQCDLNPQDVVKDVNQLICRLKVVVGHGHLKEEANRNATKLFGCFVRSMLCSKNVCENWRFSTTAFRDLLTKIEDTYKKAKIEPGEMVGSIAAQSIGEPAMQMTLNTFHFAGVSSKNVTLGVPRFNEIINTSKATKSPSMTIFLQDNYCQDKSKVFEVLNRLKSTTLAEVTVESKIFRDTPQSTIHPEDNDFVDSHFTMFGILSEKIIPWVLRFTLSKKEICKGNLKMESIAEKIDKKLEGKGFCACSDDNADLLVIRVYLDKQLVDVDGVVENEDYTKILRVVEAKLSAITLKGITNVGDVTMREASTFRDGRLLRNYVDAFGSWKKRKEWILETEGTNLLQVFADKNIDFKRTITNDIWDAYNTLGIEAARKVIEMELHTVLRNYGLYVNHRHLSLLCDVMTSKGHLVSITRHGINSLQLGPLMRCTFEQSGDVLVEAAAHSEKDFIQGVSESVILGQVPRMGTGCFDLVLDPERCNEGKSPLEKPTAHLTLPKKNTQVCDASDSYRSEYLCPVSPPTYSPSNFAAFPSPLSPQYSPQNCSSRPNSPPYRPPTVSYAPLSPPYNHFSANTSSTPSVSRFPPANYSDRKYCISTGSFYTQKETDADTEEDFEDSSHNFCGAPEVDQLYSPYDIEEGGSEERIKDPSYSPFAPVFSQCTGDMNSGASTSSYRPNL